MIQMHTARIKVEFDEEPPFIRKPPCPDRIIWQKSVYHIEEMLSEWRTDGRLRSKLLYVGVARIHYRIRVAGGRIFEIYFDPRTRPGQWILSAEVFPESD